MARPLCPHKQKRDDIICRMTAEGHPRSYICRHLGVSASTVKRALLSAPVEVIASVAKAPLKVSDIDRKIGWTIRTLRELLASRTQFALLVPTNAFRISQIEDGVTSITLMEAERISVVFGLTLSELIDARQTQDGTIKPLIKRKAEENLRRNLRDFTSGAKVLEVCKCPQ